MKVLVIFSLVAAVIAGPATKDVVVTAPDKVVVINEHGGDNNYPELFHQQGNNFEVAQYIAYQFHQAQQRGYTPSQMSEYLVNQGFPQTVAEYFAKQYEAGLSQDYFHSPYHIFQHYFDHGVPQESQDYIYPQIAQAYQQYHNYWGQYGPKAYEQNYSGIPEPISQYVVQQGRYYAQNGIPYHAARYAFHQLQQAKQYAQKALQYFATQNIPQQNYQYIYSQLQQAVDYIDRMETLSDKFNQFFIPYFVAQYYEGQFQQAYQYLYDAYLFIKKQPPVALPQYFIQQVQYAHVAAQNAYQTFQRYSHTQNFSAEYPHYYVKILQFIQAAQKYIQAHPNFAESSSIYQQLTQAQNVLEQLSKQTFSQKPFQQAYEYLYAALKTAQQQGYHYIAEYLQYALQIAQKMQYFSQYSKNGQDYFRKIFQKYFNKESQNPSYPYGSASYQYGSYGPQSSSASEQFQYGGFTPFPYGSYASYSPYQYEFYTPHPYGSYGPYSQSYGYQYGSYNPPQYISSTPSQYGSYSPHEEGSYGPYSKSYGPHSIAAHEYGNQQSYGFKFGSYSPHQYGYFGSSLYDQDAAAAA